MFAVSRRAANCILAAAAFQKRYVEKHQRGKSDRHLDLPLPAHEFTDGAIGINQAVVPLDGGSPSGPDIHVCPSRLVQSLQQLLFVLGVETPVSVLRPLY